MPKRLRIVIVAALLASGSLLVGRPPIAHAAGGISTDAPPLILTATDADGVTCTLTTRGYSFDNGYTAAEDILDCPGGTADNLSGDATASLGFGGGVTSFVQNSNPVYGSQCSTFEYYQYPGDQGCESWAQDYSTPDLQTYYADGQFDVYLSYPDTWTAYPSNWCYVDTYGSDLHCNTWTTGNTGVST